MRVGVEGVAKDGRLAMEGATDGTEVSGRPSAENDGSVARTEGGGSMQLQSLPVKSIATYSTVGHAYPTSPLLCPIA